MKKFIYLSMLSTFFPFLKKSVVAQTPPPASATTIYHLKANTIDGKVLDFSTLKGKKILIVNTASECGYTPQYEDLEKLYKTYGPNKFVIIGFPANDFGSQEPGTNNEIATFCQKNYGVTFQMMEKITVKGDGMHPVYKWLCNKSQNGVSDAEVKWNFGKFLIDENGYWVASLGSRVKPFDEQIVNWITKK